MIAFLASLNFVSINWLPLTAQKKISKETAIKMDRYLKFMYKNKLFYLIEDKLPESLQAFTFFYNSLHCTGKHRI